MSTVTSAMSTSAPEQELLEPPTAVTAKRGLRLVHLWAIVPIALAWFSASIDTIEPFDFWWNVKSGEIMAHTGQFLSTDVLVWTPVRLPYYNAQWGSQLLFYWIYSLSPYLLLTMRAVIVTGTMGLILWLCRWRSGSLRIASVVTLVTYFTAWTNYGIRPQIFAFLPFIAFVFLLERKDAHPRWLPLLVPIMLFWVNVHGSFFLGMALLGIYAAGTVFEKTGSAEGRRWLISRAAFWQAGWLAAAALATLANPYFLDVYNYFFVATNDPIARSLNIEWQAPTLYDGTGQLFYAQMLLFLASVYFTRRRLRPTELLLVLAFGYLSLTSLRNVIWWSWVTAPMIAANLAERRIWVGGRGSGASEQTSENPGPQVPNRELPVFNWLLAGIFVVGALVFTPLWRPSNPLVPPSATSALAPATPTALASFLKSSNLPAPLFNYMEWGGYLEWELYPRYQMFIDGRFEARQVQVWKDYISISRARADWQNTLDRYGVRTLVLNKEYHTDLIPVVAASSAWRKVYEDKSGVVFTR